MYEVNFSSCWLLMRGAQLYLDHTVGSGVQYPMYGMYFDFEQVVELKDAKVLLKEDDDLIITVYDYWLNKRLKCTVCIIDSFVLY